MATANGTGAAARLNSSTGYGTNAIPGAPAHAKTLLDIAGEIRRWGSVGLFGTADRLEALAQEGAAEAPAPAGAVDPYTADQLDNWWSALYRDERKAVLFAGIASGQVPTPDDLAAAPRTLHVGGHAPFITILGNDRMVTCPLERIRTIEEIVGQASAALEHGCFQQRLLTGALDRLAAIRDGKDWQEINRPGSYRQRLVYVKLSDFDRGVDDAERGIFSPSAAPAGAHLASWLLGVAEVLGRSEVARQRLAKGAEEREEGTSDAAAEERMGLIREAAIQADTLMETILDGLPNDTDMVALLSMAVRVRDLIDVTSTLASESEDCEGDSIDVLVSGAETTKADDPRTAGAQSLKRLFIALREAEDAAYDEDAGESDPARFVPILEFALNEADGVIEAGFREGFQTALLEWLLPTLGGCTIGDPRDWEPLAKERIDEAGKRPPAPWELSAMRNERNYGDRGEFIQPTSRYAR